MRSTTALMAAGALAAVLAGCGGSSSGGEDNPIVAQNSNGPSSAASCPEVPTPSGTPQQYSSEPKMCIEPVSYTATIVTNQGTVVATLDGAKAPHTVNSFKFLADHKYFDGSPCHRLTTQGIYVLQCGDPTGTGSGAPGYKVENEKLPKEGAAKSPAGTVAMANSGPDTNGSQFFLVYKDTQLPPNYTIFGQITKGLDILEKVAAAGEDTGNGDGKPKQPVTLDTVTVSEAGS